MIFLQTILFNVLSVIFGVAALVIPVVVSFKKGKCSMRPSLLSISFYAAALISQLFEMTQRAKLRDWSGIADTIDFTSSTALLVGCVVILLNFILIKTKS